MTGVQHTTFVIERELAASPHHAFRFFSEPALKLRWNECHPDWSVLEDRVEFRVGGVEAKRWRTGEGDVLTFFAHYLDIVPAQRIIYAFDMTLRGERLSASLATVEFKPSASLTRMLFTEQMAYLGDEKSMRARIDGTGSGFDRLVEVIAGGVH